MLPIPIQSVGVVSPLGIGFDAFAAGLRAPDGGAPVLPTVAVCGDARLPTEPAHWMHDFDATQYLGSKGVSTLDRSMHIALVAAQEALRRACRDGDDAQRASVGVVLGSMAGSMRSIADFVRSTYTSSLPHLVSPMNFPNAVMNSAAGQCAIWHGLRGVNSTVCAGEISGLSALQYAARMIRRGHASRLLVGAIEEYCDYTAWSHQATRRGANERLGEGGSVVMLGGESSGAIAELHGVRTRVTSRKLLQGRQMAWVQSDVLCTQINLLLAAHGVELADLSWWQGQAADCIDSESTERRAFPTTLPATLQVLSPLVALRMGNSYAASTSLQLAAALAIAPEGLGLVTAVGSSGQVACALINILPSRTVN